MPTLLNIKSQQRMIGMSSCYDKLIQNSSDKILMNHNKQFPFPPLSALHSFQMLKNDLKDATLVTDDPDKEFKVKTDARNYCIVSTLKQQSRPVAFIFRSLNPNEIKHHIVEKEAAATIEALRKWRHSLLSRRFRVITGQKSIGSMFDNTRKS